MASHRTFFSFLILSCIPLNVNASHDLDYWNPRNSLGLDISPERYEYFLGYGVALPIISAFIWVLAGPTTLMMLFIYSWKLFLPGKIKIRLCHRLNGCHLSQNPNRTGRRSCWRTIFTIVLKNAKT